MRRIVRPFVDFWNSEARSGFILFAAAVAAFAIANSPASSGYFELKQLPVGLSFGDAELQKPLASWVKDLLMAFFFLLVGLEIKREIVQGELSDPRRSLLTILAALGGMVVPALIYLLFNAAGAGAAGWGVPMATDIAFAIGVLSLLGKRVPLGLKVFLTALAIVDDLGAVLVIAFFYTQSLDLAALLAALGFFGVALLLGRAGVTNLFAYLLVGAFMWYFTLESGVSPTTAAVLLALAVPLRRAVALPDLRTTLDEAARRDPENLEAEMGSLEDTLRNAQSPLHRLERTLHPWSAYFIMPLFAFFNAGVSVAGAGFEEVAVGASLGLLLGKPLGVFGFSWLAVRFGIAALPAGVTWPMILGVGFLGAIGFTMSLFVAALAFEGSATLLNQAKIGVLSASVLAALVGIGFLAWATRRQPEGADVR